MLKIRVQGLLLPFLKQKSKQHKQQAEIPVPKEPASPEKLLGQYLLAFYILMIILFSLMAIVSTYAQTGYSIKGRVTDEKGDPLTGALIKIKGTTLATSAGKEGYFSFRNIPPNALLIVSFIGYQSKELKLQASQTDIVITLSPDANQLEEVAVVSTGYQQLPKERATGSFVQVDSALFNRRTSTDILTRLDGMASGIFFNGTGGSLNSSYTLPDSYVSANPMNKLGINIRGQSTLSSLVSKDPLIVVDNFPFEGDINALNPDIVESVSVLKDAAAASIWGARAGNGVIVITTKKGKLNQRMQVDISANTTIGAKPDLYSDKSFLESAAYISAEDSLYSRGYLAGDVNNTFLYPAVTPFVSIREQARTGKISSEQAEAEIAALKGYDVRKDIEKYVYQASLNQQYALSARGGGGSLSYAMNLGFDKVKTDLKRNGYERFSANWQNSWNAAKNLDVSTGILYSNIARESNNTMMWGSSSYFIGGSSYDGMYPYARLADAEGKYLDIAKKLSTAYTDSTVSLGFLDWRYSPLDELDAADNSVKQYDLLLKTSVTYRFIESLKGEVSYQNERQTSLASDYYGLQSWYARDLINQFSQFNPQTGALSYPVPKNGILNRKSDEMISGNFRAQINYDQVIAGKHALTALAGAEWRQTKGEVAMRTSYGYDKEHGTSVMNLDYQTYYTTNAGYGGYVPAPPGDIAGTTNRFLSGFANLAYSYDNRYVVTASARKDGSNIFGVKTNNKFVPLWSAGLGWNVSNEAFYRSALFPYLKLRATYGYNGNAYNGSAFISGYYTVSSLTGAPVLSSLTAPNPELRWEKVRNINLGMDFETTGGRISGTFEWFSKKAEDLIDDIPLAASSGFLSFIGNYAATLTKGVDLSLKSRILRGPVKWDNTLLLSTIRDKVLQYYRQQTSASIQTNAVALVGKSLFGVYSYRWAGLDPENGNPRGYLGGAVSEDYPGIVNNFNPDSLVYHGSARPTTMAAWRNDFSAGGFSLSVNLAYKGGYYFRRSSAALSFQDVISTGGHADYVLRWQKPGDEQVTSVPSVGYVRDANRNNFYAYSEVLVEKADNIRLQDVRLSYQFPSVKKRNPFRQLQVYVFASNLGIVWRANNRGLDPDAPGTSLPASKSVSFGIKMGL
ncbi:SusC/RagA family TonB-linked outer membrane protein [Pararcticibacter amylolyticus]|uniref:SusC/RagA family TonB-linked outer membrane protein n=1 Tax=Pararcticibacter amylolyticus TaxID=2173175 RepID=A0A2U2PD51_9SPHI|nr:SusC/RagA family TonB-linked outer membrane protein [Pararcticibacter amylolyticus]PWG79293.1 SusC/RagA family TonB-linked outer membrane protein [Pararcticibacter amylolyticus]